MPTEADTCRTYVLPALYRAGWADDLIREQVSFTDGRIIVAGGKVRRGKRKRVDYLLSYRRDLPLAVVEAKQVYKLPGDGLQQAKTYGEVLDLKFVYSTNGIGIVEFDYTTGLESELAAFPAPEDLWRRHCIARRMYCEQRDAMLPWVRCSECGTPQPISLIANSISTELPDPYVCIMAIPSPSLCWMILPQASARSVSPWPHVGD